MRTQIFLTLFLSLGALCVAQELTGPDRTVPGTLASFEIVPAQEASWHLVTPSSEAETYKIDSSSAKIYFSSPKQGRYTVVAGIVIDGKPELLVKTFTNSEEEEDDQPLPLPVPPISSLETWMKTQTPNLVKSKDFDKESRLVADCFELIVQRIDESNIKTAPNARTQLQIALTETLAQTSPTAVTDWTPFLTELSRRLEQELGERIDDLAEVKRVIQNVSHALQSLSALPRPIQHIDDPAIRTRQSRPFRNLLAN
jgi:hypothetical protein